MRGGRAPLAALAAVAEPGGGDALRRRRLEASVLVAGARDGEARALALARGCGFLVRDGLACGEPIACWCEAGGGAACAGATRRLPTAGLSVLDRAVAGRARLVLLPTPDTRFEAAVVRQ